MDDSPSVDFVDVSLIGSPDRFQVAVKHLWRTGKPHSDDEKEDTESVTDDSNSRHGSPQWLPRPSKGSRRLKPLTVDTNLSPPFLLSPGYPSIAGSTPSPSSYTLDYFDLCSESLLPLPKVDDDMRLHHYHHLSIYGPVDFDEAYAWDLHSRFPAFWESGDDSDASEPSDKSTDYITFTGRSVSIPPELELGFRQFNLSEPSPLVFDFPEDVGESLEHEAVLADGDSGMIGRLGRPTLVEASETSAELSMKLYGGSQSLSISTSDVLVPRMRAEDSDELEPVLHLPNSELDVTGDPISVPVALFVVDGFPDDTTTEVERISVDTDWLGGALGETICDPSLEEELLEWNRWRGQLIEELDRDLDSWTEFRESARAEV